MKSIFIITVFTTILLLGTIGYALAGSGIFIDGKEVPTEEAEAATIESKGPVYGHGRDVTSPEDRARNAQIEEDERSAKEQKSAAEQRAKEDKAERRMRSRVTTNEMHMQELDRKQRDLESKQREMEREQMFERFRHPL